MMDVKGFRLLPPGLYLGCWDPFEGLQGTTWACIRVLLRLYWGNVLGVRP